MAENYKLLYHQMKLMVEKYQDEVVPKMWAELEKMPKWISCDEALPIKEDASEDGLVLAFSFGEIGAYHWKIVRLFKTAFTHWMPFSALPQPPKGDE